MEELENVSLDMKEELVAIGQWFDVLTEGERMAALYKLLTHTMPSTLPESTAKILSLMGRIK